MSDDDSPEDWMVASKRRGAMRLLVLGLVLLVGGGAWAATFWNDGVGASPITYVRVVSVLVLAIGTGLAGAGALLLARTGRRE